ncbi:hypothetical protein FE374_16585 [Georgenia yuyongxinii]|uniref:Helix-turn-helix domain-containing protein n=1 Tax=Georgenia yuyongxinii TaxID=2589797 RepID=A0A5B8C786_9MICO|nr:hypothetical protein [Georgenia yuyongxinii]QDC26017.1 hypothetical protein FE374_16585 [Georgenia yuyongxinii]
MSVPARTRRGDIPGARGDVLTALRDGASPAAAAARIGRDPALVDVMVDHYRRLGLVADPGCSGPCVGAQTETLPPGCRGCPLAG